MTRGLLAVLALAVAAAPGCSSGTSCTLIGCSNDASVTLSGLATKYASALPLTIQVCLDGACTSYKVEGTAQAPTCANLSGGGETCTIDPTGTVVLGAVSLPSSAAAGAKLMVTASVTSNGQTIFSSMQSPTVQSSEPNGPSCPPVCESAAAVFTP